GSGLRAGSSLAINGQLGDDLFNVTSSVNIPISIDGDGGAADTLHVDGETTLDYTINAGSFTAAGRQAINYVNVENLALTSGAFGVHVTITPNVAVNTGATLYG